MRSFEERKAEILRRSESRIKEQKRNRNKAIAICIPLCLCISVFSVMYLLGGNLLSNKAQNSEDKIDMYTDEMVPDFSYTSLEIKNNSDSKANTKKDTESIEKIYNLVESAFNDEDDSVIEDKIDQSTEIKNNKPSKGENHSNSLNDSATSYSIIFYKGSAKQVIYTLNNNLLTKNSSGQTITLTKEQLARLQKALELILKEE